MNKNEIFEKVKKFIADEISIDPATIQLESSLQNDLGCDSLDAIQIVMSVEETYGLSIDIEDAKNFLTVKDVCDYIENHVN